MGRPEQYDPEKLALLIEKQTKDLKFLKVTAAAALTITIRYLLDEAVDILKLATLKCWSERLKYSRHKKRYSK